MYYKNNYEFKGECAKMVNALLGTKVIDYAWRILAIAPIVGILEGRKEILDDKATTETKTIFYAELENNKSEIMMAYRIVMLLNYENSEKERKENAFKYDDYFDNITLEERRRVDENYKTFDEYLKGGVAILYSKLVEGKYKGKYEIEDKNNFVKDSMDFLESLMSSSESYDENIFE